MRIKFCQYGSASLRGSMRCCKIHGEYTRASDREGALSVIPAVLLICAAIVVSEEGAAVSGSASIIEEERKGLLECFPGGKRS